MMFSRQMDSEKWGADWPAAYAEAKDDASARRIAQMVNFALERAEEAEKRANDYAKRLLTIERELNGIANAMATVVMGPPQLRFWRETVERCYDICRGESSFAAKDKTCQ